MFSKLFILALAASPLVAAHGKIAVMTGDAGGNTTGLGIQGAVIPGAGTNKQTEVDTTVFNSKAAASDGLGKTKAGANTLAGMSAVMAQSGTTLAQASPGGSISGTVHIVTTDGAGPYTAIVDPTGTGAFSTGTKLAVTQQVPGKNGNIAAPKQRSLIARSLVAMGIVKRASNVNEDYPFAATIPAGTTCTGTVGGQSGVCLVKIVNPSNAGPFGGVIAMQMAGTSTAAASNSSTAEKRELVGAKFRA
ncbi:probable gEgh 16 protein [Phialocephala subalpina]|uniref:Probable gEgh 16 protein n=1 Tax=Phialocephala subalpina TaxID=576137 RepID=A0A1L7XJJ4_9HELO|nr:probable gEgh 16 protein [Phialocephala subalpina]